MTAEQAAHWLMLKPADMPVFVLLGTDPFAADIVRAWAVDALAGGVRTEKIEGAYAVADAIDDWDGTKLPD